MREKEVICNGVVKWGLAEPVCIGGVGIGTGKWMNIFIVRRCKYVYVWGQDSWQSLGKSGRDYFYLEEM